MGREGPRRGRAAIEDVAQAANVSTMTVSRALRGVEGVSAAKRAEIIRLARKLDYRPNSVAGALATANSTLIGISVPTLFEVVFAEIFDAMRATFDKAGLQTVIDTSEYSGEREERWVERMLSWRPAGVILTGADHNARTLDLLKHSGTPTLEIWDYTASPIDLCVGVDHFAAGRAMAGHLLELGYRAPAYVGVTPGKDLRAEARLAAFCETFSQAGVLMPPEARISLDDASFASGRIGVEQVAARTLEPDVIYFLNDHMAVGGMMACERRGLRVPEDIGIAGFNGLQINTVLPTPLTTSITPRTKMGELGARQLVGRIRGAGQAGPICLPVALEAGQTTRPQAGTAR